MKKNKSIENLQFLGTTLVIEPIVLEEKKQALIITPLPTDEIKKGKVVNAGIGYYENGVWVPNHIQVGAIVYYKLEQQYEFDGFKFLVTNTSNVIAVLNSNA